jgi:hypothetical protein
MIIENIIRAKIKANAGKIQEIKRVRIVMLIFDRSKQTIHRVHKRKYAITN